MSNMEIVSVDGSTGEGGGQILRTSLALSCITGRSLHIENIRAARRNPGLAKQHLSCVRAACQICSGKRDGAVLRSKVLDFHPGPVQSGDFYFDIGSAGSASLVIQTVLPALFLADSPSAVTVTGGTHNPLAPPFDFLSETFLPAVEAAGFHGTCKLVKHGFFPAGGGKITFNPQPRPKNTHKTINFCEPADLPHHPLGVTGKPQISARIYTAKLPENIASKQRNLLLQSKLDFKNIEHIEVTDSDGPGNCVMIRLCSSNRVTVFTAFGQRGKQSHKVINEVVALAKDFLKSGAAVDSFLADQLLIYMAISKAGCFTTNELTAHLTTNMEIIKKFLDVNFCVDKQNENYKVLCYPA
jgi:RNA 3'-terminal phosphate cyclase (ATP)